MGGAIKRVYSSFESTTYDSKDMVILGFSTWDTLLSPTKRMLQEFMKAAKAKRSTVGNDGKGANGSLPLVGNENMVSISAIYAVE
jgi:hypothetical protein